jgi:hypothetical protein
MSLFFHAMLSTYGMVLAHLQSNALLVLAIFQHLCETYVMVRTSVALFCIFFEARLAASGAISGCLTFRLCPSMVMRFIPMLSRDWEEWQVNWCFVRFTEEDDPVAYAEPTGSLEVLPAWTSPASTAGLEAAVERIQNLQDLHLAAHHMVNSYVRHNIAPLQRRSCPHWEVLSQNHPTRLHQESPSDNEILTISNFLTGSIQTKLLRPKRVRTLIRLSAIEREAIVASMPLCDEWGLLLLPRHWRWTSEEQTRTSLWHREAT